MSLVEGIKGTNMEAESPKRHKIFFDLNEMTLNPRIGMI